MSKKSELHKTICLVGCGKQKTPHPGLAKDIYTSSFFRRKRQYAERFADIWFIISAKHHVLKPDSIIAPYDESLIGAGVTKKKTWAAVVAEQLRTIARPGDTLIILGGKDYFEHLLPLLPDLKIELPLKGLRQGEQNQWLKGRLEND